MFYREDWRDWLTEADLAEPEENQTAECQDCRQRWNPGLIPASRYADAEEMCPDCPHCGGPRMEEMAYA